MALFIPCPVVPPPGPGPSLVFSARPGFGPHTITSVLANNVLIRTGTGFGGTALFLASNASEPMDIGTTIRIYNTTLGSLFISGSGGVVYTGPASIVGVGALVVSQTAIDDWIGAIQPFPTY